MTHDPLRFDFIQESAELIASYSISLSEASRRSNAESCRVYFDCIRAIARDLNKTLQEIENGVATEARRADERKRVEASRDNDAVRGNQQQRSGLAHGANERTGRQSTASRVQIVEPV